MIHYRFFTFLFILLTEFSFSQNQRIVDSVRSILNKQSPDTIAVNCFIQLGSEYKNNEPQKAMEFAKKALDLSQKLKFKQGIANSYHLLGMINSNLSNNDKAMESYLLSLKINEELGNKKQMSTAYNNIGSLYYYQGNYEKALKYYLISLEIDESLNEQTGMASSYNNVGLIYWAQNNLDKARDYFQKAVTIYSKLNDKNGLGGAYSNIGGVAYYKGETDVSILYFKKSYEFYKEINFKPGCAVSLINISEIYTEQKKYSEALKYVTEAIEINNELGNKSDMAYGLLAVAKIYYSQKQYQKAIDKLEEVVVLSNEIKAQKQLSQAYLMTSEAYSEIGNYKQAYESHKKYSYLKDSMFSKESSGQIAEMNIKYDTDKKNREIELLKKEKEIQSLNQEIENARSTFIRNSLISGCIFILLIVAILFNRNKVKQKANNILAEKNKNIEEQKEEIELKNGELALKNKEITSSIVYAKNIQNAILPPDNKVQKLLPDSFVLYKPKDIVSGDFYWLEEWGNRVLVAAADCTGHGVPGAFMSIVGNNLLQQAISVYGLSKPFLILNNLNKNISKMLNQSAETIISVKDGMDIALLSIDKTNKQLEFAGAFNPLWIIRNKQLIEIKADKHPVGAFIYEELKQFTPQYFETKPGDILYIFTDGYADQFGGPKGKKYKYKSLQELLISINELPMSKQKEILNSTIEEWKGNLEQVDDILIIGIRI